MLLPVGNFIRNAEDIVNFLEELGIYLQSITKNCQRIIKKTQQHMQFLNKPETTNEGFSHKKNYGYA